MYFGCSLNSEAQVHIIIHNVHGVLVHCVLYCVHCIVIENIQYVVLLIGIPMCVALSSHNTCTFPNMLCFYCHAVLEYLHSAPHDYKNDVRVGKVHSLLIVT